VVQLQQLAAKFLSSTKDFPPGRIAGSFNLVKIQKEIEINAGSKKNAEAKFLDIPWRSTVF
jgi:hypothetical protein